MAGSDRASLGGEARRNNDPNQIEKAMVYECWRMWQKTPSDYTNNSSFAQKMLNKFQPDDPSEETLHLQSTKVISDWCAAWKGGALFGAEKAFLLAKAKQK